MMDTKHENLIKKVTTFASCLFLGLSFALITYYSKPIGQNIFPFLLEYIMGSGYLGIFGWFTLLGAIIFSGVISFSKTSLKWKEKTNLIYSFFFAQFLIFCFSNPILCILYAPVSFEKPYKLKILIYFHSFSMLLIEIFVLIMCWNIILIKHIKLNREKNFYGAFLQFMFFIVSASVIFFQVIYLVSR
jgi:hypothetical protein